MTSPKRSTISNWWRWLRGREGITVLAILLLAALLRGAYLLHFSQAPDFEYPAIDAGFHDSWARSLALPDWEPPAHVADPEIESSPYLRPPGYPYFLAGIYSLFGGGYLVPRIIQLLLGLAGVGLVYTAGRRIFGHASGAVGAMLVAVASPLIYFEGEFHGETLLMPLLLGLLLVAISWRTSLSWRGGLAAGLLLGIAALVRSNVLILAPILLLWIWLRNRAAREPRRVLASSAVFVLGIVLAISPATVRNQLVAGEFVPISSNLGVNLLIGNNPAATPYVAATIPGVGKFETCYDYPALVASLERKLGRELNHSEVSAYFTGEAWDWIVANPGSFVKLTLEKAWRFWGPVEVSHNKVIELEIANSAVLAPLPYSFPLLLGLAVFGMLAWWRERRVALRSGGGVRCASPDGSTGGALLIGLWILGWFLSVLPFFVAARYRLPLIPLLALPAGYGVVRWYGASVARFSRWPTMLMMAVALWGLWFDSGPGFGHGSPNAVKWHMDRGRAYNRGGDTDRAIAEFEEAVELNPLAAEAHFSLGHSMSLRDDTDAALRYFEEAARLQPDHTRALNNAGSLLARKGRLDLALPYFERLTAVDPFNQEALANLALAHARLGQLDLVAGRYSEAMEHLNEAMRIEPTRPVHARDLALLLATCPDPRLRDGVRAVDLAGRASRATQDLHPGFLEVLAAAHAETGDFGEAERIAERALLLALQAGQESKTGTLQRALAGYRAGRPFRSGE
jgi:tetratricopeptide (TPR) repeat protein